MRSREVRVLLQNRKFKAPKIVFKSGEKPAVTHLCSYASSHTNGSTTRLIVSKSTSEPPIKTH
jgi:hypothetical protein